MGQARTVRIFLADGNAAGIRHAEVVNWTGQAIVIPRHRVGELKNWAEAHRPGVYFLFGDVDDKGRRLAYIGEAEDVFNRLRNHVANKEFWANAVFFTSKDDNLTKSHVKYLESRLVEIAKAAGRASLENGNAPRQAALPRSDIAAMEEFLEPLRLLLSTLGFPALEVIQRPSVSAQNGTVDTTELTLSRRGITARGAVTDEGFLVYEGSTATTEVRDHLADGYVKLRAGLVSDGILVDTNGDVVFSKDYLFSSPSAAAATLLGGNTNGREAWKAADGRTLKELEEAAAQGELEKAGGEG